MATLYQCPFCPGEARLFEKFVQLTGHVTRAHHGQRAIREECEVEDARPPKVQPVADPDEGEAETVRVQAVNEVPVPVEIPPPRELPPGKPLSPLSQKLLRLMRLHRFPEEVCKGETELFNELAIYQSPANLGRRLRDTLGAQYQKAIDVIVAEMFPQEAGNFSVEKPVNRSEEFMWSYLDRKLAEDTKPAGSDEVAKMLYQSVMQMKDMLIETERRRGDLLEAKIERLEEKLEHRRLSETPGDFETKLLEMADSTALPALLGEGKEIRKAIVTGFERIGQMPTHGQISGPQPGVLSEDESSRLAQAMEIRENLRDLVAGKTIPGSGIPGNGHEVPVTQQPSTGSRFFE